MLTAIGCLVVFLVMAALIASGRLSALLAPKTAKKTWACRTSPVAGSITGTV